MAIEFVEADPGAGGQAFALDNITGGAVPYAKLMSGTDGSEELLGGDAANGLDVDVTRVSGTVAVSNAGLTELAAAINASAQVDVNIAASGATVTVSATNLDIRDLSSASDSVTVTGTVAVTNAGLTELAAAINASSQMDVNIAASAATLTVASHAVTNAGTFAVQVDGAALTSLQLLDDAILADDAAFTPASSKVMMSGFQADEGSTDSVDEGDAGAARMTLDRKVITTPQPHTAGGLSIFRSIDLDEGTLEVVKNAAGQIYGVWVANTSTGTRFIKFYDATSGTYGTGTPVITLPIPGNSADDVTGMFSSTHGIAFATGICVGAGTGVADNDTGAPGANDIIINVFYK